MSQLDIIQTDIGLLQVITNNGIIYDVSIIDEGIPTNNDPILINEIKSYFKGICELSSRYILHGTTFQNKVWEEIIKIPYGQTRTYSDIAIAIGSPTAHRAVANACGQNKILLFIPCHRVTAKNSIGGFKYGIEKKQWLINMELH